MNKKMYLFDIESFTGGGKLKVVYKLLVDNTPFDLEYTISLHGADSDTYSINEVPRLSDPVVVSLMYNMLVEGYDFESEIPISPKLYHHLTKDLIPHLVSMNPAVVKNIEINVPISLNKIEKKSNWIGTGVSCGIDSFSAIKEYSQENDDEYKLTHLLYFKIGAHHGRLYPCPEEVENRIFSEELEIADRFCKTNGFKLVVVDSNVNQMANKFWGAIPFANVALFRNAGAMLTIQSYFSKYVLATTYATFDDFSMNISDGLEHNLWWSMPLLGSDALEIIPAGSAMNRIEKTKFVADFTPSHDNLMVCWAGHKNCGECDKCIRTLVALDFIGSLDLFKNSFDLAKYKACKNIHLQHVVAYQYRDPFFRELVEYAKEHQIALPNYIKSVVGEYYRLSRKNKLSSLPKLAYNRIKSFLK